MGRYYRNLIGICFLFSIVACQTIPLSEQNTIHPEHQWNSAKPEKYLFNITDTSQMYKIVFVIRHHNAYHYKNIWLQVSTKSPSDSAITQTLNLQLADDQKGWLGVGMDDIFDQRIPINATPTKLKLGIYNFSMQHTMREDPLLGILATGLRVEKVHL